MTTRKELVESLALAVSAQPKLDKFAGFRGAATEAGARTRGAVKWVGWTPFALAAFTSARVGH